MGGFLYIQKEPNEQLEDIRASYRNSIDALRKKRLPLVETIVADGFVFFLFNKINVSADNLVRFDGADFAASTGTLIYDGVVGTEALTRLYHDFPATGSLFSDSLGHYCILLFKQGSLYIFTDYHGLYRVYTNPSKTVI